MTRLTIPPMNGAATKALSAVIALAVVGVFGRYMRDGIQSERISRLQEETREHVRSEGHRRTREDIREITVTQKAIQTTLTDLKRDQGSQLDRLQTILLEMDRKLTRQRRVR